MDIKDDGGPAFPAGRLEQSYDGESLYKRAYSGMSLRDWFAAMALRGIVASGSGNEKTSACADAYEWADAMLAERNK